MAKAFETVKYFEQTHCLNLQVGQGRVRPPAGSTPSCGPAAKRTAWHEPLGLLPASAAARGSVQPLIPCVSEPPLLSHKPTSACAAAAESHYSELVATRPGGDPSTMHGDSEAATWRSGSRLCRSWAMPTSSSGRSSSRWPAALGSSWRCQVRATRSPGRRRRPGARACVPIAAARGHTPACLPAPVGTLPALTPATLLPSLLVIPPHTDEMVYDAVLLLDRVMSIPLKVAEGLLGVAMAACLLAAAEQASLAEARLPQLVSARLALLALGAASAVCRRAVLVARAA